MSKIGLILLCSIFSSGICDTINVDLASYKPQSNNVYKSFETVSDTWTKIKIKNINDIGFFIIQIHTYVENVILSYNSTILIHNYVEGTNIGLIYGYAETKATNIGLIYGYAETKATFYLNRNFNTGKPVDILLVITVYDKTDPIPGGCNLTFDNIVAPYQIVSYNDEVIIVNSQPPLAYGVSCNNDTALKVDMYHMYLKEGDNNISSYFDGLTQMMTVNDIKTNGRKVPDAEGYFKYRRLYSSYRGTGEVFAIIATYKNKSSAYVPAISYGCDLRKWSEDCVGPVMVHWRVICALFLIAGSFACFSGHKFFKFNLFVMGFIFGVVVTYIGMTFEKHFSAQERTVTSLIMGSFCGAIWNFIWWKFGVPLLSAHLAFMLSGVLLASVVFYGGLSDFYIYNNDINFWVTFSCIVVATLIISTGFTLNAHIFACCFIGSYAFVTALNYYVGGNLQYVVINTYRRITVKNFNMAVIDPPFQTLDIVHTILWSAMLGFGFWIQWRNQKGKPPFPPHRNRVVWTNTSNDRTPLIRPESPSAPQYYSV